MNIRFLLETAVVAAATAACLAAAAFPEQRRRLTGVAAVLFSLAVAALAWHLLADHFRLRYVWLYSGPDLPWHLKLANLWGGDEGTLLFIAAILALVAARMRGAAGWALPGVLVAAAAFGIGAMTWNPFVPTGAAELAELPYRGMNAHLMVIWMALHPPLVFIAYALLMTPAGAALGALLGRSDDFRLAAGRWFRWGWLLLTTGIAGGMWWAFEDYTFGQAWHWDPVQTSVFAVWCLATAVLHGLARWRPDNAYARVLPLLTLATTAALLASMAVTRNDWLQSSHRYVGDTSGPLFAALVATVIAAMIAGWVKSRRARPRRGMHTVLDRWVLLAIALFTLMALAALAAVGHAMAAQWLQLPRPEDTRPFFEMLLRFSRSDEVAAIREVFATWDVDGFALNRALAPAAVVLAVTGAHVFLVLALAPALRRRAWIASAFALAVTLAVPHLWQPFDGWHTGAGMTSQKTVAMFYWLDALLIASLWFALAAAAWLVSRFRAAARARRLRYVLPVAAIHVGAMVALVAVVFASVLDRYVQAELDYPAVLDAPQPIPGGLAVTLAFDEVARRADGGRVSGDDAGFTARARVQLAFGEGAGERIDGRILYRDSRPRPTGLGSMRELCRVLDYRYARFVDDGTSRLDPFIHRGWLRDVQVWLPPSGFVEADGAIAPREADLLVVVRIFPLMSWLWVGLALVVIAALVLTVDAARVTRRPDPAPPPPR